MTTVSVRVSNGLIRFDHKVTVGRHNGPGPNYRAAALAVCEEIQAAMDRLGASGGDGARAIGWLMSEPIELCDREGVRSCGLWGIEVTVHHPVEPDDRW